MNGENIDNFIMNVFDSIGHPIMDLLQYSRLHIGGFFTILIGMILCVLFGYVMTSYALKD